MTDSWLLQQPRDHVSAILKTEGVLSYETLEHSFNMWCRNPQKIPWIYQYCHLMVLFSLFCCFNNVNQPSFLSTQCVLHNTCQTWQCNYISRFIKRCCISQSLHYYHQSKVSRHWTVSPTLFLTLILNHRPGLGCWQTLQHVSAFCGSYGGEQSQVMFMTRTGYSDTDYIIVVFH